MTTPLRRFMRKTVFWPVHSHPAMHSNEILASYYHRSAATLYLIYFGWAIIDSVAALDEIDYFFHASFDQVLPFYLIPFALAACIGATFFPKTARLELFASAGMVTLVLILIAVMAFYALQGSEGALTNLVLNTAHLVVPISRMAFIYRTLIRQAKRGND